MNLLIFHNSVCYLFFVGVLQVFIKELATWLSVRSLLLHLYQDLNRIWVQGFLYMFCVLSIHYVMYIIHLLSGLDIGNIGVYSKLTNAYCLVQMGFSEKFYRYITH